MDVDQAFLHGDLKDKIYMEPPYDFLGGSREEVWLLKKPLYGLKQAPREWYAKLKGVLLQMGFQPSISDPCLFLGRKKKGHWILVYVDDLLIMAPDAEALQEIKNQLHQHFPLKDLGPVTMFLGMEVNRNREAKELTLHQGRYIQDLEKRFAAYDLKRFATPLAVNHKLTAAEEGEERLDGDERYPELVGCLMYLMICTRPDIAHTLSVLGRFVAPGRHAGRHWKAALRVLGYVLETADMRLTLGGGDSALEGFTDASWADIPTDRRSSQGYCFSLGKGMIRWKATKSPAVALSTCEAELYGGASAAQELMWLKQLMAELGVPQAKPTLWCDNESTVAHTQDPIFSARSKHIEARYFFIRELIKAGRMDAQHIAGEENPADLFTKPLFQDRHMKLVAMVGLKYSGGLHK